MSNTEQQLRDFIELDETYVTSLKGRAQFYLQQRHLDRALMILEMLHALDHQDLSTQLLLGQTHLEMGYSLRAAALIEPLVESNSNHQDAKVLLARIRIAQSDLGAAANLLTQVVHADPTGTTQAGRRARSVATTARNQLIH